MTRYTNFARKRTYVQAGFNNTESEAARDNGVNEPSHETKASGEAHPEPEKKKRKRVRAKKPERIHVDAGVSSGDAEGETKVGEETRKFADEPKKGRRFERHQPREDRKQASEQRRVKRINDRNADTTCFACREKGHTARDCTNSLAADAHEGERGKGGRSGRDAVGICYRCGSRRHNLSKCKETVDPENPLPFASCFVCSGKGHLASKCPKNQSKGIYPNGGCCKLCKETTHLAKDCPLRKKEVAATTVVLGTGREAGADEDDFHTFKRINAEVDQAEKAEERAKRRAEVKVGAHSGVVKAFGNSAPAAKKKKVVFF